MSTVQCCMCLGSFKKSRSTATSSGSIASSSKCPVEPRLLQSRAAAASSSSSQQKQRPQQEQEENIFSTRNCNHHACRPCLAQYFLAYVQRLSIKDDYSALDCPELGCEKTYDAIEIVAQVMPSVETAHYWWRMVIEKTIMDSIGYCPYPDCQGSFELPDYHHQQQQQQQHESTVSFASSTNYFGTTITTVSHNDEEEDKPIFAECLECNRGICLNCQSMWHPDKPCKPEAERTATPPWREPESRRQARARKEERQKRKLSVEARNLARKKNWTRCPRCQEMVERAAGCNSVLCSCGTEFCYRCGSLSSSHRCSRNCHMLSPSQLDSVRNPMFSYN